MQLKINLSVFLTLAILMSVVIFDTVMAKGGKGKGGKGFGKNLTCKGEPIPKLMDSEIHKSCRKELKGAAGSTTPAGDAAESDDDDASKKGKKGGKRGMRNTCMQLCVWKKQKIMSDDGKYNAAGAEEFIKSVFPSAVVDDMKKASDDCASTNGASFSTDNNCAGYQKFAQCSRKKTAEICGWPGNGKKGGKKGKKGGTTEAPEDI